MKEQAGWLGRLALPHFAADQLMEYILIHYRWVFVCLFLLPLSLLYDVYWTARGWLVFILHSAPRKHHSRVHDVQRQVHEWRKQDLSIPMCTARPGWQSISFRHMKYKESMYKIRVNLVDILKLDAQKKIVWVEPLVTMGQLSKFLNPRGWTLPVVPEMDDLTVGGLVMGTGIESSSHQHGLFQHICQSYEMVLADGRVVNCSKEENTDLFYAIPWSYGTLGFLTAVELKIVPAQRFLRVEYEPVYSVEEAVMVFERKTMKKEDQFVEGIMFNHNEGVIMTGNMVSSAVPPRKVNRIGRWYKQWFFKHVQTFLRRGFGIEYIPLRDYYHRHSRSIFWEIQDIIPFGNNAVFRYLFGWLLPPKVSLLKLTQGETVKRMYENNHFIQDMLVPINTLRQALDWFHKEVKLYPVWLCPFILPNNPGMIHPQEGEEEMYVDIGLYGLPAVEGFQPVKTTRKVEAFARSIKGFQMLYADCYMTRNEFRQMFDHTLYDRVREKLGCISALPDIYDKINYKARG